MFEFKGYLDNVTQKHLLQRLQKITAIGAICAFLFLGIPGLFAWIYYGIWVFFMLALGVTVCMFILTAHSLRDACPTRIVIDLEKNEIFGEYRKGAGSRSIDDVKKVLDFEKFYHILFYFPNQWSNCICQKDLIVEGTIEEFEKLFEDKIVRKYKTEN